MSTSASRYSASPFSIFSKISGKFNTVAPFFFVNGKQESITGNNENISVDNYNSKLYTTSESITLNLGFGIQEGQLKKLTFSFQGVEDSIITVSCPSLIDQYVEIIFQEVGDQCLLMWNSGHWTVLSTENILNPGLNSPIIQ